MNITEIIVNAFVKYINFFDTLGNMQLIINGEMYTMDYDFIMTMSLIILGAVVGIVLYSLGLMLIEFKQDIKAKMAHRKLEKTLLKARKELNNN